MTIGGNTKPYEATAEDNILILGTTRRWIEGKEEVWSYEKILESWGYEFENYRLGIMSRALRKKDPGRECRMLDVREKYIKEFGFSIPCKELINLLKEHQPIVEVGAGTGFITKLSLNNGIDIIGTDPQLEDHWFKHATHDNKQIKMQGKTAVRRYRDRTVFNSWASLNRTWFRQTVKAMRIGQKLIVVKEDCCAEDSTWSYISNNFAQLGVLYIPCYPFISDTVFVYQKVHQNHDRWHMGNSNSTG